MVTKGGGCNLVQDEYEEEDDDDYIDMEIGSNLVRGHSSSLSSSIDIEFEFQMLPSSLTSADQTANSSPSLFYRGKLLPLHHGLHTHLQTTNNVACQQQEEEEELFRSPLATTPTTPFESCTVSPCQSCRRPVIIHSHHLHFKATTPNQQHNKKPSWISIIKQSSIIASKLKAASKACLNSLFPSQQQRHSNLALKTHDPACPTNINVAKHRRSLSINTHISSSSNIKIPLMNTSNSCYNTAGGGSVLKRSSSFTNSESPIQGAIAHCNNSSSPHDIGFSSAATISEHHQNLLAGISRG